MRLLELLSALAALVAGLLTLSVLTGADLERLVIAMILCFVVVGWQMVTFFMGRSIQGRRGQEPLGGDRPLPAAQSGTRPSLNAADTSDLARPPSVTENTTALLDPVSLKKGGKK